MCFYFSSLIAGMPRLKHHAKGPIRKSPHKRAKGIKLREGRPDPITEVINALRFLITRIHSLLPIIQRVKLGVQQPQSILRGLLKSLINASFQRGVLNNHPILCLKPRPLHRLQLHRLLMFNPFLDTQIDSRLWASEPFWMIRYSLLMVLLIHTPRFGGR